jgi:FkbM family methyltransferase
VAITLYTIKRALLAPRTAWMRRRERKDLDQFERSMLELHYYSRAMSDMRRDMERKPDLLYDFELDPESVVFDVGAYHGEWSETIAGRYGARIHAFEPDPTSFPRLVARLGDRPGVVLRDYGLAAADQTVDMALAGLGSSVYTVDAPMGSCRITLRDVAAVLDELGVERIDLLKINIEGGEYDLLERLIAVGWLPRIRQIVVQFHEWHPKAYRRRRAIRRALRRDHHEVWCYPWIWELWRRDAR